MAQSIARSTLLALILLGGHPSASESSPGRPSTQDDSDLLWSHDFEAPNSPSRWEFYGPLRPRLIKLEEPSGIPSVFGRVLDLRSEAQGRIRSVVDPDFPDLRSGRAIRFGVRASEANSDQPIEFEVRFFESTRPAWMLSKVRLTEPGWQVIELPLNRFRTRSGASIDWEDIDHLGFRFRTRGSMQVDGIEVLAGSTPDAGVLSAEQLARDAFGPSRYRILERKPFAILTDDPDLDLETLMDALLAMNQQLDSEFPNLEAPDRIAPLVVFRAEEDYRSFWPRFAQLYGGIARPPQADGFTALGVATTFRREGSPGGLRPSMVHEAVHALFADKAGIDGQGSWLTEGLAVRYQLRYQFQDLTPLVRQGIRNPDYRMPLSELLNGNPIPLVRYWQATSVLDWMMSDPARRDALSQAILRMVQRISTDLVPLAEQTFGMSIDQIERQWLEWAADQVDLATEGK